jgi:hypothetical protein
MHIDKRQALYKNTDLSDFSMIKTFGYKTANIYDARPYQVTSLPTRNMRQKATEQLNKAMESNDELEKNRLIDILNDIMELEAK